MATHTFSAVLQRWGRTYGVDVPTDVSVEFGIGGHVPVVGTIHTVAFQSTLVPIGGARHRLLLNAAARTAADIIVGDSVEVSMAPDPSNRMPPIPDDLADALDIVSARSRFDSLPSAQRREMLLWIADAGRPEARSRRVARAVARVMEDV
jgi:hypothetical protein